MFMASGARKLLLCGALLLGASAVARGENACSGLEREACAKDWTVLLYMAADNDLGSFAHADLAELARVGSSERVDVIVQLDMPGRTGIRRLRVERSQSPPGAAVKGEVPALLELLPETGETEEAKLRAFLAWGLSRFPARRVAVILWGHGNGWTAAPALQPALQYDEVGRSLGKGGRYLGRAELLGLLRRLARVPLWKRRIEKAWARLRARPPGRSWNARLPRGGIAWNETSGSFLTIPELGRLLREAALEHRGGRPFELYISDACNMQSVEVARELAQSARYVVGSAAAQDERGLPYDELLRLLDAGATADDRSVAMAIPALMDQVLALEGSRSGRYRNTLSAVESASLDAELVPALGGLSRALAGYLAEDWLRGIDLRYLTGTLPAFFGSTVDLRIVGAGLELLLASEYRHTGAMTPAMEALREALLEVDRSLRGALLSPVLEEAAHLAVWLPASKREFRERAPDHGASLFARESGWQEWLAALYLP